jgi:ribosomal protein L40E
VRPQQINTSVWDAATALATLAAVLATLYISVWRERWRRPHLTLRLTEDAQMGTSFGHEDASTCNVATLAVSNANGRRTAEDVQVLLTVWRPGTAPIYRLVNQRRLQWWYGDEALDTAGAVTTETLGPGVSRPVALALLGHPKAVHEALRWEDRWAAMDDEAREFWRDHRHGIWAISPIDAEGGGWIKVGDPLEFSATITARDVDAQTYYSRITLTARDLGPEHGHFAVLTPTFSVFSKRHPGKSTLSIADAHRCPSPVRCSARNWPWATRCWRCGWGLLG